MMMMFCFHYIHYDDTTKMKSPKLSDVSAVWFGGVTSDEESHFEKRLKYHVRQNECFEECFFNFIKDHTTSFKAFMK